MLKIKSFHKFFEEVELNLNELGKLIDSQFRGNVLIRKIQNSDPLTLENGENIIVHQMKSDGKWVNIQQGLSNITDPEGNYDIDKALSYFVSRRKYQKVFKDIKGNEYSLNQLKKTKDFGSTGAGRLVREFESLQAVFIAIKQAFPDRILTPRNCLSFYNRFLQLTRNNPQNLLHISEKIQLTTELLETYIKDKHWIKTFCDIPNELWGKHEHIDKNKIYHIFQLGHEGNSPIKTLQKKYNQFAKDEGFKDINFAKWCPADVFLVDNIELESVHKSIIEAKTISELTQCCDDLFDKGLFIPLSLKKIGKSKILIITNKEKEKELPQFYITNFILQPEMKGIGSKISTSSKWKYRDRSMTTRKDRTLNIDSSDTSKKQNVDAEVEGSTSRHGKISFTAIKRIIDHYRNNFISLPELNTSTELVKLNVDELEDEIKSLTKQIENRPRVVKLEDSRGSKIEGHEGKLISKLQSLQIVSLFSLMHKQNPELSNEIITKIMQYALSIKTDKFDSPRYLRVL